jgi:DNA-binding MarR family transcriptional regulator
MTAVGTRRHSSRSGHPEVVPEAELAARLRLSVARLARRLRTYADSDISPSQLSALATVARLGPLTLGDLTAAERVKPPTMTRVVACLEELGLVTRTVDPSDRRVAHVEATPLGQKLLAKSRSRKDAYLTGLVRTLSPAERGTLEAATGVLERLLETDR